MCTELYKLEFRILSKARLLAFRCFFVSVVILWHALEYCQQSDGELDHNEAFLHSTYQSETLSIVRETTGHTRPNSFRLDVRSLQFWFEALEWHESCCQKSYFLFVEKIYVILISKIRVLSNDTTPSNSWGRFHTIAKNESLGDALVQITS